MPKVRCFAIAFTVLLASCRGGDAGTQSGAASSSATSTSGAPEGSAAPAKLRLFGSEPIFLRDVEPALGRPGAPREMDVRAKVEVTPGKEGRVEIPLKVACRFGDRQVAAFSKMITAASDRFSLQRPGPADAYAHAGAHVGWLGAPEACEITFRLAPIGVAKQAVRGGEEKICLRDGAVAAGGCNLPAPKSPAARFEAHDVEADVGEERVEVHAHLQTRDAEPPRAMVTGEVTCEDEPPTSEFELMSPGPFPLAAGESRALHLEIGRAGARAAKRCTLALSWRAWNDDVAEAPVELGKWCVSESDTRPTPGACAP